MDEQALAAIRRYGRLAFVAAVTTVLLALTFAHAGEGTGRAFNVIVYGLTVGFGLEFLGSAWKAHWRNRA